MFFTYYGMMSVSIVPMPEVAQIINGMLFSIMFIFGGFFISQPNMPPWWGWYYWLDPLSYAMYGIIGSQLGDVNDEYIDMEDGSKPITVAEFVYRALNYKHTFIGWCVLILIGFTIMFVSVTTFALAKINFNKR